MINIPIYRAKRLDNGEYIEGYYTERVHHYPSGRNYINFHNGLVATYEIIDPTTLAIHFPDMLDSQGNKIFASLSEDGKGGDIIKALTRPVNNFQKEKMLDNVIIFDTFYYRLKSIIVSKVENYNNIDISYLIQYRKNISTPFEVIGIQE